MRLLVALVLFGAGSLLFSGLVLAQDAHSIQVQSAWMRASITPKGPGVAYLTIMNADSVSDRLTGAAASVSDKATLHAHVIANDAARMQPIDAIPVPAGEMTMLKPGGHHIMLHGLSSTLKVGGSFPLVLVFEKAGEIIVDVQVLAATATGPQKEHDHAAHAAAAADPAKAEEHGHAPVEKKETAEGHSSHGHTAAGAAKAEKHQHAAAKSETGGHDHASRDHAAAPLQQHADARPKSIPENLDVATRKLSAHAKFEVEVATRSDHIMINEMHAWTVRIRGVDGTPVDGANVHVTGGMPLHGHRLPTAPQVTEYLGDGTYLLEGVRFNMAGWWEVTLAIESGHQQDTVTFNLVLN